jgi:acyl-CoA carboxylase subunit beta
MSTLTRTSPRIPQLRAEDLRPLPTPIAELADDPLDFPGYRDQLQDARRKHDHAEAGVDESVTVGLATLGGLEVVAAIGTFGFLGGSMGRTHGERIARALATAHELELPFVAVTASGGARMQEGMASLIQMTRAAEGVRRLREAGIPVLARFTSPTTGGVHASYGALADVIVADAGATIGFAGPRVVEAFTGDPVGEDSHTAEAARRAGLVDEVVPASQAEARLAAWVRMLHPGHRAGPLPTAAHVEEPVVEHDAWEAVRAARRPDRPSARDLMTAVFDDHLELHGDRAGEDDPAVIGAVARLGERRVVVVGMDRHGRAEGPGRRPGQPNAAGYRKLRRAIELADRWRLGLVALIDTPGADPSPDSDRAGLAAAIAETFVATLSVAGPTVAVVTGEGGSGGALALGATDRLLMQDDAVFEVIAPEGAASILHRDPTRAEEVAPLLRPTASELRREVLGGRPLVRHARGDAADHRPRDPGPAPTGADAQRLDRHGRRRRPRARGVRSRPRRGRHRARAGDLDRHLDPADRAAGPAAVRGPRPLRGARPPRRRGRPLAPTEGRRLLLLAWILPSFLQGAAGFGAPIAMSAPMLVRRGMAPVAAVAACLIGYQWSVTFGSMGSSYFMAEATARLSSADAGSFALRAGVIVLAVSAVLSGLLVLTRGRRSPGDLWRTLALGLVMAWSWSPSCRPSRRSARPPRGSRGSWPAWWLLPRPWHPSSGRRRPALAQRSRTAR